MLSRVFLLAIMALLFTTGCESKQAKIDKASQKYDWGKVDKQIEILEGKDPQARRVAVHILGTMGPKAEEAIPALEKLTQGSDSELSAAAEEAIEKIKGE